MSTVEFTLRGLAACYHKEDEPFWTIMFPTDEKHRVKFTYVKSGLRYGPIELADVNVIISASDSQPPQEYEDVTFTKFVLDLTGDYLHKEGIIKNTATAGFGERKLQIPYAMLRSERPRKGRLNYIFPFNSPDGITLLKDEDGHPQQITMLVGGSIIVNDKKVTIEIDQMPIIELSAGDSFQIDNDCHDVIVTNDFQLYQKLYSNMARDVKFEAISINDPLYLPNNSSSILLAETRNPPNICETVRISKPQGLS